MKTLRNATGKVQFGSKADTMYVFNTLHPEKGTVPFFVAATGKLL
jgi:hypothetical protein